MKIGGSIASIFDSSTTDYKEEGLVDKQHQPTKQKQRIVNRGTLFYVIICMLLLCDSFIDDVTCFSSSSLCKPPKFFEPFSLLQTTTNLFILTSHIERESERGSWELLLTTSTERGVAEAGTTCSFHWRKRVIQHSNRSQPNTNTKPTSLTPSIKPFWFGFLHDHHHWLIITIYMD